jgi:hypothetical protein
VHFERFIPFSFFVLAYEVTKILRNSSFIFFIIFHILYFRTVDAKTEHMELKISKPTLGVLLALTKNELTNM